MDKTIKVGIAGAKFAGDFHAQVWKKIPGVKIEAIADLDAAVRSDFMKRHGVVKGYGRYEELVSDPEIDVVDVCLPNFLHSEVSIAAMTAGKHVICEKPVATTIEDGEGLVACQSKTGQMFFYAEDWIFAPSLVRTVEIMQEGGIGKPLYFKGKECHNGSHSPFAQKINFCGGGSLIHLGVHPVGFFTSLLGMPESVVGKCSAGGEKNIIHKELEGEDWAIGVLSYRDGVQAVVEGNYITQGGMDDVIEVYGTEGVIKINLTFGSPLRVYSRKGFQYTIEKADFTHGWSNPAVDEYYSLGYRDELTHFLCCISGTSEQADGTTAEAGLNVLRIIDAIYRSNREGKSVTL